MALGLSAGGGWSRRGGLILSVNRFCMIFSSLRATKHPNFQVVVKYMAKTADFTRFRYDPWPMLSPRMDCTTSGPKLDSHIILLYQKHVYLRKTNYSRALHLQTAALWRLKAA